MISSTITIHFMRVSNLVLRDDYNTVGEMDSSLPLYVEDLEVYVSCSLPGPFPP